MKLCAHCQLPKPISDFHRKGTARICKACKSEYNKSWYQRNKQKHVEDVKRNNARYQRILTDEVRKRKSSPCSDCGESYPYYVMDFDHVSGEKIANISRMVSTFTKLETVLNEIAKCEVVCANCHRERTFGPCSSVDRAAAS